MPKLLSQTCDTFEKMLSATTIPVTEHYGEKNAVYQIPYGKSIMTITFTEIDRVIIGTLLIPTGMVDEKFLDPDNCAMHFASMALFAYTQKNVSRETYRAHYTERFERCY